MSADVVMHGGKLVGYRDKSVASLYGVAMKSGVVNAWGNVLNYGPPMCSINAALDWAKEYALEVYTMYEAIPLEPGEGRPTYHADVWPLWKYKRELAKWESKK